MVNFKENDYFLRFRRGSNFFQVGWSNFFQGGGNCLFPIEPHLTCDFPGGYGPPTPPPPPPLDPRLTFSTFLTLLWCVYFSTLLPLPPKTIPRFAHTCTILHIMYLYIYHFLVSWKGREFDYWHTNRVGSVLSAAHTL